MITRRKFLSSSIVGGAAFSLAPTSFAGDFVSALAAPLLLAKKRETLITILHTNDTHSQIDPIPAKDKLNGGQGGVARRATLVRRVRRENPNTLLIDAGDSFQGTPYFNFYKGEVEFKSMSMIGYDAATLGNHEFDNGVDALAAAMKFANFDFVSANYDVHGTALEGRVKPYVVRELGGVRIGLFGLGVNPNGLITPNNFKGVKYVEPVRAAVDVVKTLRGRERCSLVIAMTHLGYFANPKGDEIGDSQIASQVDGINFIAGGHTHTFMHKPVVTRTPSGANTTIFQVGKSGIYVGRVDIKMRSGRVVAVAGRLLDLRDVSLV